jgi:hypothetical protein
MRAKFFVVIAAFATVTSACASKALDGTLPAAADLRSGYSVIDSHDNDTAYNQRAVIVTDVALRGTTIVVSAQRFLTTDYLGGGAYLQDPDFQGQVSTGAVNVSLVYFVSHDAGATWAEHPFDTGMNILNPFGSGAVALLADETAIAIIGMERSRIDDTIFTFTGVGHLDLDSGTWKREEGFEFHGTVREEDGIVYGADTQRATQMGALDGYGNYFWTAVNAQGAGSMQASGGQAYTPADCVVGLQGVGDKFGGLCQLADQTCYYTVDPRKDTALQKDHCVATATISDAMTASFSSLIATNAGPTLVYTKNGHARALVIRNGFGPSFDLGEGTIRPMKYGGLHDTFPGLAVVQTGQAITAVYDLLYGDPVAHALPVPRTPCRDDARCPTTALAGALQLGWVQRVGLNEHIVIHDVRTSKGQVLTFGRETGLLPIVPDELPKCPGAVQANAMWKACYGEELCKLDYLGACLARWSGLAASPAHAAEVSQFLAADVGKCAALQLADRHVAAPAGDGNGNCTARCDGDIAVSCGGGGVMDCVGLNGGKCTLSATGEARCLADQIGCDPKLAATCDSQGRVLDCQSGFVDDCPAHGQICQIVSFYDRPRCMPNPDPCAAAGTSATCDGTVFRACIAGQTTRQVDCGQLGMNCTPQDCQDASYSMTGCQAESGAGQCNGTKFELFGPGASRIIDCADFAATCGIGTSGTGGCLK